MDVVELTQESKIPQKRGGGSLFNIGENKFLLIGGANRSEEFNDVWVLEIKKENNKLLGKWSCIDIPLSCFTPRIGQCGCINVATNNAYLFGEKKEMLLLNNSLQPQMQKPQGRNSSTLNYSKLQNKIYLFGGADDQEPLADLYEYDLTKQEWKKIATKDLPFKGLEMHTAHIYESDVDFKSHNFKKKKKQKQKQQQQQQQQQQQPQDTQQQGKPNKNQELSNEDQQKFIDIKLENIQEFNDANQGSKTENASEQQQIIQDQKEVNIQIHKTNIEFDESNIVKGNQEGAEEIQEDMEGEQAEQLKNQSSESNDEIVMNEETKKQQQPGSQNEQKSQQIYEYLIVIGGRQGEEIQNQIWALNLQSFEWIKLFTLPLKLCAQSSELVNNCIYMFGGTDGTRFLNDLLVYSLQTNKLYSAELKKSETKKLNLEGRMASSMSFDSKSNNLLIFGGCGYEEDTAQTVIVDTTKINILQRAKLY